MSEIERLLSLITEWQRLGREARIEEVSQACCGHRIHLLNELRENRARYHHQNLFGDDRLH